MARLRLAVVHAPCAVRLPLIVIHHRWAAPSTSIAPVVSCAPLTMELLSAIDAALALLPSSSKIVSASRLRKNDASMTGSGPTTRTCDSNS